MTLFSGRGVCFCSAVFMLCTCFPLNCSDDTRFTGICFGAWGVIEQSNERFYTQTQSFISKPYMFLVSARHFVLQGHAGRNNLSSYTNEVNMEGFDRYSRLILAHHCQLSFFTYMTMVFHQWFYAIAELATESLGVQSYAGLSYSLQQISPPSSGLSH